MLQEPRDVVIVLADVTKGRVRIGQPLDLWLPVRIAVR
jgi:hypothetical protein